MEAYSIGSPVREQAFKRSTVYSLDIPEYIYYIYIFLKEVCANLILNIVTVCTSTLNKNVVNIEAPLHFGAEWHVAYHKRSPSVGNSKKPITPFSLGQDKEC